MYLKQIRDMMDIDFEVAPISVSVDYGQVLISSIDLIMAANDQYTDYRKKVKVKVNGAKLDGDHLKQKITFDEVLDDEDMDLMDIYIYYINSNGYNLITKIVGTYMSGINTETFTRFNMY